MSLPKFMVMKSNVSGKYLRYGKGKGSTLSSLTFSHEVKRPNLDVAACFESLKKMKDGWEKMPMEFNLLKFEVEEAKTVPGFVHIRTSYNNKYLVRKSEESKSLAAEAHEAEEDQSKWSCTLFKPIFLGEAEDEEDGCLFGNKHGIGMTPQKIELMQVVMGQEYYVSESMELLIKKNKEESLLNTTLITVSDVTPTALLPQHVTFKSHDGSKYVGTPNWHDIFFQYTDMAGQGVAMFNPMGSGAPGYIFIVCSNAERTTGGFWKVNQNNDVGLSSTTQGKWFSPVKVGNYVALYSTDNNKFVHRNKDNNGVSAYSSTIIDEAKLEVGEPVVSRTILSITYDLDNARVYNTTSVTKITDSRSNYTDEEETGSLSRDYTMSRTMTWDQSITVSIGMSMSMSFGVPEVGIGGEVSLNYDISVTCDWGEEKTDSETITHVYNFDVPPHTKQTKTVVASRSSCDVPFTCEVEDLLTDGTTYRYTKTDCWFTGANDYNANEETHDEPLTP